MQEWYLKMMRSEPWSEAKNYAQAAGYDLKQLFIERFLMEHDNVTESTIDS